jgi:hypothetical protein
MGAGFDWIGLGLGLGLGVWGVLCVALCLLPRDPSYTPLPPSGSLARDIEPKSCSIWLTGNQ